VEARFFRNVPRSIRRVDDATCRDPRHGASGAGPYIPSRRGRRRTGSRCCGACRRADEPRLSGRRVEGRGSRQLVECARAGCSTGGVPSASGLVPLRGGDDAPRRPARTRRVRLALAETGHAPVDWPPQAHRSRRRIPAASPSTVCHYVITARILPIRFGSDRVRFYRAAGYGMGGSAAEFGRDVFRDRAPSPNSTHHLDGGPRVANAIGDARASK